jgi:hypothetical protein
MSGGAERSGAPVPGSEVGVVVDDGTAEAVTSASAGQRAIVFAGSDCQMRVTCRPVGHAAGTAYVGWRAGPGRRATRI